MKKLIFVSLFFLIFSLISSSAFALIVTDNTDEDNFLYEVPYQFATSNLAASLTASAFPIISTTVNNTGYLLLRAGKIVGISVAGDGVYTGTGGATFDVTINGTVTGVQGWIQNTTISALGNTGSAGPQYSYIRQYRNEIKSALGFRKNDATGDWHNRDNPYGKATPLVAGDRIGVKVTTSSGWGVNTNDYVVTVYVLE